MFSVKEKQYIASQIEKLLLEVGHPEMPKEKPVFKLHVDGKESWSFADIEPNWKFDINNPPVSNPWNEIARHVLDEKKQFEVHHWDTFDNETFFVDSFDTVEQAETFIKEKYRVRDDGADQVDIIANGNVVKSFKIG